jgi:hypothetical protein
MLGFFVFSSRRAKAVATTTSLQIMFSFFVTQIYKRWIVLYFEMHDPISTKQNPLTRRTRSLKPSFTR